MTMREGIVQQVQRARAMREGGLTAEEALNLFVNDDDSPDHDTDSSSSGDEADASAMSMSARIQRTGKCTEPISTDLEKCRHYDLARGWTRPHGSNGPWPHGDRASQWS